MLVSVEISNSGWFQNGTDNPNRVIKITEHVTKEVDDIPNTKPNSDGTREYYVITYEHDDLHSIYTDLETEGVAPPETDIIRSVNCIDRKPNSRSTLYELTDDEVFALVHDIRVLEIHLHPKYVGIKMEQHVQQSSDKWTKSTNRDTGVVSEDKNWALYRCTQGSQTSGWGGPGYDSDGVDTTPDVSGTIELVQTGKNVDVINVDDAEIVWHHPEFYSNPDGTGTQRLQYFNWYQYNPAVTGEPAGDYPLPYQWPFPFASDFDYYAYHPTHVTGTIGGNTQGWARDANLYHIAFKAKSPYYAEYCFNYVKEFHTNKSINPATGRKNPTIMNNSWGFNSGTVDWADVTELKYRDTLLIGPVYNNIFEGGLYVDVRGEAEAVQTLQLIRFNGLHDFFYQISTEYIGSGIVFTSTASGQLVGENDGYGRFHLLGTAACIDLGLTASTTPTVGNNDDGYWTLTLPFPVTLGITSLGQPPGNDGPPYNQFSTVYVSTNGYLTFEVPSSISTGIDLNNPDGTKIVFAAGDRSVQRIYYGTRGTSPDRIYTIRIEGDGTTSGTLGSPGFEVEISFCETLGTIANNPTVAVYFGTNNCKSRQAYPLLFQDTYYYTGIIPNRVAPSRQGYIDADMEDCIKAGVISVGSAGNSAWKCDTPDGLDYDNYFKKENMYGDYTFYYHRGSSPTANETKAAGGSYDIPNICVGSVDSIETDQKAGYSNTGPMIDIWAPGTYVMSAFSNHLPASTALDSRDTNYRLYKISGTSMAAPQVTGVLACALETYPDMDQVAAKSYITSISTTDQLYSPNGGYGDTHDLQGAPNKFLLYRKERNTTGTTFPKLNYKARPTNGRTFPRTRIRR